MTCEFRLGAPYWGTGGPEFKSRRSDQKFTNKSKALRRRGGRRASRNKPNEAGINRRRTAQTTSETSSVLPAAERIENAQLGLFNRINWACPAINLGLLTDGTRLLASARAGPSPVRTKAKGPVLTGPAPLPIVMRPDFLKLRELSHITISIRGE